MKNKKYGLFQIEVYNNKIRGAIAALMGWLTIDYIFFIVIQKNIKQLNDIVWSFSFWRWRIDDVAFTENTKIKTRPNLNSASNGYDSHFLFQNNV